MKIYAVAVNRDDTVQVVSAEVVKETPAFYIREDFSGWSDPRRSAFQYSKRIEKARAHLTARAALTAYMERRQRDKQIALTVAGQAAKQIASANELLMRESVKLPPASDAVDPAEAVGRSRQAPTSTRDVQHKPNCNRNVMRHADDSTAYLSEKCTCGLVREGDLKPAQTQGCTHDWTPDDKTQDSWCSKCGAWWRTRETPHLQPPKAREGAEGRKGNDEPRG